MRFLISFLLVYLIRTMTSYGQETTKILFIGNSLTYSNDMPQMVENMLKESGKKVKIFQKTDPGKWLKQHFDEINGCNTTLDALTISLNTFESEKFDFIILQEANIRLLVPTMREESISTIHLFSEIAKKNNSKLLFFQPYPLYNYPQQYCYPNPRTQDIYCSENITSNSQELSAYSLFCNKIHNDDDVGIIPIGKNIDILKNSFPNHNFFSDDGHPSKLGSYLISFMIYQSIVKKDYINNFSFINKHETNSDDIRKLFKEISF